MALILKMSLPLILLLALFTSCKQRSEETTTAQVLEETLTQDQQLELIIKKFKELRQYKLQTGQLLSECPPVEIAMEKVDAGMSRFAFGGYDIELGDYNMDGKTDGLFIIHAEDCLQSNGRGPGEDRAMPILISWKNGSYEYDSIGLANIRRKVKDHLKPRTDDVDVWFTDVEDGEITGTYEGHRPDDPSIFPTIMGEFKFTVRLSGDTVTLSKDDEVKIPKEPKEPKGPKLSKKDYEGMSKFLN
jgi:hypothetical protein